MNYTDRAAATRTSPSSSAGVADAADAASERTLLVVPQPFANHNGGGLAFGPDGLLYIGLGDGGSGGDPLGNGQNLDTLLGKLLRIDVDRAAPPYAIPADNPFAATPGARPEIWAYGLRNPFRFSLRPLDGRPLHRRRRPGRARGGRRRLPRRARRRELRLERHGGHACYQPASGCNRSGLTLPVYEYGHDQGCSITGGVVYRGCRMPALAGTYFFGDFCRGSFARYASRTVRPPRCASGALRGMQSVSSFGADADGELYVVDYAGSVFRLEP